MKIKSPEMAFPAFEEYVVYNAFVLLARQSSIILCKYRISCC